jgi:hypothetical protein
MPIGLQQALDVRRQGRQRFACMPRPSSREHVVEVDIEQDAGVAPQRRREQGARGSDVRVLSV